MVGVLIFYLQTLQNKYVSLSSFIPIDYTISVVQSALLLKVFGDTDRIYII
jgi:hypothetical protein